MDATLGLALLLPTLAGLSTVLGSLLTVFLCKPGPRFMSFVMWSALSGLAEPVRAVLAAVVLLPFLNATVLGLALAAVTGVMVFISLDVLIPVACSLCEEHLSIVGVMAGMVVTALGLGLLR
jgi:zinc transporter ZupT